MNHATEDELLLLAYRELPEERAAEIDEHVAACGACHATLRQLERGRVALEIGAPPRRRAILWRTLAVAAAAAVAAVVITKSSASRDPVAHWAPTTSWSATAGYVTGGKTMRDIDAQLTRLEQERYYGSPN